MRTDLYTKTVLTVIAACLVWMCLAGRSMMPVAKAQGTGTQQVILMGWTDNGGVRHPFDTKPLPVAERK